MPIRGMTDRGLNLPEIGRIHKGAKKEPTKPGPDLDYFRVEFDERETETAERFTAIFGERPDRLRVMLPLPTSKRWTMTRTGEIVPPGTPGADPDNPNWSAWYEAWLAGGMLYRGDGQQVAFLRDGESGETRVANWQPETPCYSIAGRPVYEYTTQNGKRLIVKAKAVGRLRVLIPELERFAYLTLVTGSKWDVINLSGQMETYMAAATDGNLQGVPFILGRRPQEISTPTGEGGKPERRTKSLLYLEADPEYVRAKLGHLHKLALLPPPAVVIEGVWRETPDDDEDDSGIPGDNPAPAGPAEHEARSSAVPVAAELAAGGPPAASPRASAGDGRRESKKASEKPATAQASLPLGDQPSQAETSGKPGVEHQAKRQAGMPPAPAKRTWPGELLKWAVDNGMAQTSGEAAARLDLSAWGSNSLLLKDPIPNSEVLHRWLLLYQTVHERQPELAAEAVAAEAAKMLAAATDNSVNGGPA